MVAHTKSVRQVTVRRMTSRSPFSSSSTLSSAAASSSAAEWRKQIRSSLHTPDLYVSLPARHITSECRGLCLAFSAGPLINVSTSVSLLQYKRQQTAPLAMAEVLGRRRASCLAEPASSRTGVVGGYWLCHIASRESSDSEEDSGSLVREEMPRL